MLKWYIISYELLLLLFLPLHKKMRGIGANCEFFKNARADEGAVPGLASTYFC